MILEHTRLVTPESGPRPAGKPDECFYCKQPVGSNHKEDCVCFRKVVMVRATLEYPRVVPACWTQDNIEFQLNESSWCANNITSDLEQLEGAEDENIGYCLCGHFEGHYLREATDDDVYGLDLSKLKE